MRSLLTYYHLTFREPEIMAAAGTQVNKGTGPVMLEQGFNQLMASIVHRDPKLEFIRK